MRPVNRRECGRKENPVKQSQPLVVETIDATHVRVGPFTWTRRADRDEESWMLDNAVELLGMVWSVTNYGKPAYAASAFSGWRYGSGGPFGDRPCETRDAAMLECVPYMFEVIREKITDARAKLARCEAVHAAVTGEPVPPSLDKREWRCVRHVVKALDAYAEVVAPARARTIESLADARDVMLGLDQNPGLRLLPGDAVVPVRASVLRAMVVDINAAYERL